MVERISESELAVMEALWVDAPATAADVAVRITPDRGWSAQTVKTLLARLVAKGAVAAQQDGRRYLYEPLVARDAHVTGDVQRLVDRLFGGRIAPLVAHLAEREELTPADIAEIEALLAELKS
jgi:BlaI family transcriptional regulator, penicillinase repressor